MMALGAVSRSPPEKIPPELPSPTILRREQRYDNYDLWYTSDVGEALEVPAVDEFESTLRAPQRPTISRESPYSSELFSFQLSPRSLNGLLPYACLRYPVCLSFISGRFVPKRQNLSAR